MISDSILQWLLEGDISIRYQAQRDLLKKDDKSLQERISKEGWGARYLSLRNPNGQWGLDFYQPKWTSTHYTLLDLRNLCMPPRQKEVRETIDLILKNYKGRDGGINAAKSLMVSDVCINGMFLNYAAYFGAGEEALKSVVDFILSQHMSDGGFNCHSNRKGAVHSSLHTTLSVAEGILEYARNGYRYRLDDLEKARQRSEEFMLVHKLYQSHRTGKTIRPQMLRIPYPSRWYYDILRVLDYFRLAGAPFDDRMKDALTILMSKRRTDRRWPLQAAHPGKRHFDMEKPGQPSRWNTLRALRVLEHFKF
jgi:hypothetical protein